MENETGNVRQQFFGVCSSQQVLLVFGLLGTLILPKIDF
jgi:hypothetical protein